MDLAALPFFFFFSHASPAFRISGSRSALDRFLSFALADLSPISAIP